MKYIRTEDGKIYNKSKIICSAFREEYCSPNWNEDIEKYLQTKIIAEADTIEKLCDEFVIKDNDCNVCYLLNDELKYAIQYQEIEDLNVLLNDLKMQNETCYGAIWTEKGLIYVAKMNGKGELELL